MKLLARDDYRYSFFDGMCANVYATLTSGVFLTGFALYLGMSELMIGVMAAIPYLVTLFQLPGSYYISKKGGRKIIAARGAILARSMWLPILAIGLWAPWSTNCRIVLVLIFFFVSHSFASVSYVAWLTWTSDLVPDEIRGTFFGTRNMLCGAAGVATLLIFGNLVDVFKNHPSGSVLAMGVPFFGAFVFGLIGVRYLNRVSDTVAQPQCGQGFLTELAKPFKEANFRNFLFFTLTWNFAVYLSAPFFALYFLRELNYSYGFVALLSTIGAVVDLLGMKLWGAVSDRIKNKAVIQLAGWGVVLLPSLWVMVRPQDLLLPILLQMAGGAFWAGVNLCAHNIMLGISPQQGRVWFISAYSITAGLGSALAPVTAGWVLSLLHDRSVGMEAGKLLPLHYIFFASTAMRIVSLLLLRFVREPQETSLRHIIAQLGGMHRTRPTFSTPLMLKTAQVAKRD